MKELIKKVTGHMIIEAVVAVILGIVLVIWPTVSTKTFIYLLGVYFVVLGLMNLFSYIQTKSDTASLLLTILELLVAIIIFIFPTQVASFIGILMGVVIILIGILNVTRAVELKKMGVNSSTLILVLNIIIVIAGFLVIFNPFSSVLTIAKLLGIVLIGKGLVDLFSCITFSKNLGDD